MDSHPSLSKRDFLGMFLHTLLEFALIIFNLWLLIKSNCIYLKYRYEDYFP